MDGQRRQVLDLCAAQPFAQRTFPFGEGVAVFKVGGRIFALVSVDRSPGEVSVKVEPELGAALVRQYSAVRPGYHLNKRHWVTVTLGRDLPEEALTALIEDAYDLVFSALPRRVRSALEAPASAPAGVGGAQLQERRQPPPVTAPVGDGHAGTTSAAGPTVARSSSSHPHRGPRLSPSPQPSVAPGDHFTFVSQ